jgi:sugar lactone lactonase YvrE
VLSADGGASVVGGSMVDSGDAAPVAMNPIAVENQLPGTTAWALTRAAQRREIEGYASAVSVSPGDSLRLFVNVDEAHSAHWELYRLGYYAGAGGRFVSSGELGSVLPQASCPIGHDTGLIECAWDPAAEVIIDPWAVTGYYVFKLVRDDGFESYVPLIVREAIRRAPLLVQASVTTWQAYNDWGGTNLYDNDLPNSSHFTGAHAYQVSFDRPYLNPDAPGSGDLFTYESYMVKWLESRGYDLAYTTNIDVDADPEVVLGRKLVLDVGHDEYWSRGERDALEHARDSGVPLGFFSGNSGYWQIRLDPSSTSVSRRVMTCYKSATLDPMGGGADATVRFRDSPLNRPENMLIGQMYEIFTRMDGFPIVVAKPEHWIYAGTNVSAGDTISHVVGDEWDHVWVHDHTPEGLEVVAHSDAFGVVGSDAPSDVTVYYPTPASFVFSAGTRQWSWGLGRLGYRDPRLERMTENVIARAGVIATGAPLLDVEPLPADRAISPKVTVIAGTGTPGDVDGSAGTAQFEAPSGVAIDSKGTLYVSDTRNHRVRAIAPDGTVTTFAGSGASGRTTSYRFADGGCKKAKFDVPTGIVVGPDDVVYVSDSYNNRIRKIQGGVVSTFAGDGTQGSTDSRDPLKASFAHPRGLAFGPDGALYVADAYNLSIRRIGSDGVTTIATADSEITAVAFGRDGALYVLASSGSISTVSDGVITPFVDMQGLAGDVGGPGAAARLRPADGLAVDGGFLIVSDSANFKVRRVALTGDHAVTTLAGDGKAGTDVGSGQKTHLVNPRGLVVTPSGYVVADSGNHRIVLIAR